MIARSEAARGPLAAIVLPRRSGAAAGALALVVGSGARQAASTPRLPGITARSPRIAPRPPRRARRRMLPIVPNYNHLPAIGRRSVVKRDPAPAFARPRPTANRQPDPPSHRTTTQCEPRAGPCILLQR